MKRRTNSKHSLNCPIFIFFILILPILSFGAEMQLCAQSENGVEFSKCLESAYEKSDIELKHQYKQLKIRIENEYKYIPEDKARLLKKLTNAQKKWLEFKNANCQIDAFDTVNGSVANIDSFNACFIKMNNQRIQELKVLLN